MAAPMTAMWSRPLRCILKKVQYKRLLINTKPAYYSTTQTEDVNASSLRDPGPVFLEAEVQRILYKVTGFNMDKIFHPQPVKDVTAPAYKLMTDKQLQEAQEDAIRLGQERLQMPPYVKPRDQDSWELISDDADIAGHDVIKYVFTDITYGIEERDRVMVVREPSGVLRTATWEERDRLGKVYFPQEGRMHRTPQMFQPENLEKLLVRGQYEYVLDRACVQFDPDDPEFSRVAHRTYEHVNETARYDDLQSTRHFGGMTFYLTLNKKLDGLLVNTIHADQMSDAGDLIRLNNIIHPDCATARAARDQHVTDHVELIKTFIANDASKTSELELVLQSYLSAAGQTATTS